MAEWDVLIKENHHAAYITWDEFERNLEVIANNATSMSSSLACAEQPVKASCCCLDCCGAATVAADCHVHYSGKIGRCTQLPRSPTMAPRRCISISGLSIDAAMSNEVLRVLEPLGIKAALKAIETQSSTTTAAERQLELSLQERAPLPKNRTRADECDAVKPTIGWSPASKHAAGTRHCRLWRKVEGEIAALIARPVHRLGRPERQQLMALGDRGARLVASHCGRNAQAYPSRGTHGDRRAQGRRNHPRGPALARR